MNKPSFTPGPYRIDRDLPDDPLLILAGPVTNSKLICEIPALIGDQELANAQLLASAPALYAALEGLLDHYVTLVNSGDAGNWDPEDEDHVKAARAALKAANP